MEWQLKWLAGGVCEVDGDEVVDNAKLSAG